MLEQIVTASLTGHSRLTMILDATLSGDFLFDVNLYDYPAPPGKVVVAQAAISVRLRVLASVQVRLLLCA